MKESKNPLVYILSNGRSGSTLLDLLLGAHPNIWTLGEAQRLPWEIKANSLCGCGVPISDCKFWQPILPKIQPNENTYPIEHFRTNGEQGKILHWDLIPGIIYGNTNDCHKRAVDIYGQTNAEFFQTVWQTATDRRGNPIHWLVDASKDIYRLFWLQKSGLFDLRVIHLIKSPSAFVYSMIKRDLPSASRKAIRMTGRWIVENYLGRQLCKNHFKEEQVLLLHYEKLASRPEETMIQIGKWLGLAFLPENIGEFRNYENHAISGNQMRWQNSAIFLDEKWKTLLPAFYIHAIWLATLPVRRIFDY